MSVVLTTHPSEEEARKLADLLVGNGLAACVQIEGPLYSTYVWENTKEHSQEWRMVLKTLPEKLEDAYQFVCANHPFEVPQWIILEANASESYLKWVKKGG